MSNRICRTCGAAIDYKGSGTRAQRYCSVRCRNWWNAHPGEEPRWKGARRCEHCGDGIASDDIRVRYCDKRCRLAAQTGSRYRRYLDCAFCGARFRSQNGKQRYCSPRCRIKRNQADGSSTTLRRMAERHGGERGERFTRRDVCERDNWVCQLCLTPIDPMSRDTRLMASVDHKVPLTKGGAHSLANVQAAHRACNAAKRDSNDIVMMSPPTSDKRVIKRGRTRPST